MAIKTSSGYKCFYCGKFYKHPVDADSCRDEHDLLYVPISKSGLNALLHYIMNPSSKTLQEMEEAQMAIEVMQRYARKKSIE